MENKKSYINRAVENIKYLLNYRKDFRSAPTGGLDKYYAFYATTNENLEYFADLGVADKDTLTVTGSGDHALNLAYFGAKSIETFDINELSFIAFDLKIAALQHLTRTEFIDFYTMPNFLDRKLYQKIYPYLNDVTKAVFDTIFMYLKSDRDFRKIVEDTDNVNRNITHNNPYLASEQTYLETQKRLNKLEASIKNKLCPAHKLDEMFEPKDIVILSNIVQYYINEDYFLHGFNFFNQSQVDDFVKSLKNVLNEDGLVSLLYMFFGFRNKRGTCLDEKDLRKYFKINGNVRDISGNDFSKIHQVFVANKDDFPQFEK